MNLHRHQDQGRFGAAGLATPDSCVRPGKIVINDESQSRYLA